MKNCVLFARENYLCYVSNDFPLCHPCLILSASTSQSVSLSRGIFLMSSYCFFCSLHFSLVFFVSFLLVFSLWVDLHPYLLAECLGELKNWLPTSFSWRLGNTTWLYGIHRARDQVRCSQSSSSWSCNDEFFFSGFLSIHFTWVRIGLVFPISVCMEK